MTTIAELLYGTTEAARPAVAAGLKDHRLKLGAVMLSGRAIPQADIAGAVADLLDVRLSVLAAQVWSDYKTVADALKRTKAKPGEREVVHLGLHTIKAHYSPVVEVEVNSMTKKVLELQLVVEIEVASLTAIVERGRCQPKPGHATAKGSLKAGDVVLATRDFVTVGIDDAAPKPNPPTPPPPRPRAGAR